MGRKKKMKTVYELPDGKYECKARYRYIVKDGNHFLETTITPIAEGYMGSISFYKEVKGIKNENC